MPGSRYLLLATHGYFAPPELGSALKANESAPPQTWQAMTNREVIGYHPGLLSGLAWAGASKPSKDPNTGVVDRGLSIMTADEVSALNLRGCDLAVLSACQTGLGQTAGGEGVLGLQRAFLQAGASTVVTSLWRVDDAATCLLVEQFYTNLWVKKRTKLEALREAQLFVLNSPALVSERRGELAGRERKSRAPGLGTKTEKLPAGGAIGSDSAPTSRSDPGHWAAFVLSGDL
jgi:CHAT domain-containing protein